MMSLRLSDFLASPLYPDKNILTRQKKSVFLQAKQGDGTLPHSKKIHERRLQIDEKGLRCHFIPAFRHDVFICSGWLPESRREETGSGCGTRPGARSGSGCGTRAWNACSRAWRACSTRSTRSACSTRSTG
jgi:hypothetical protein